MTDTVHPLKDSATYKDFLPINIWEWTLLLCLQAGWVLEILSRVNIFDGIFMFPAGLIYLHLHTLILIVTLMMVVMKRWFALPFLLFSLNGLFSDWSLGGTKGQEPNDSIVPIMTWNIQGLDTLTSVKDSCAVDFLQAWTQNETKPILLFQEVPKSAVKRIEKTLSLSCTWNSYFNHSKIGLLVCADPVWRFRFENHRTMDTGSSYGFQQVEVSQQKGNHTFNILNVHMPSLAMIARKEGIRTKQTVIETVKANRNPKTYLRLLRAQHNAHQSSIERILDLTQKLKDPTVIGGDFNMPPTGSIHKTLAQNGMHDAHIEAGAGWGFTTERFGFLFNRIDFLYGTERLTWVGDTVVHNDITCSDHAPITASLRLP